MINVKETDNRIIKIVLLKDMNNVRILITPLLSYNINLIANTRYGISYFLEYFLLRFILESLSIKKVKKSSKQYRCTITNLFFISLLPLT